MQEEEQDCRHSDQRCFLHSIKRQEDGCKCQVYRCSIKMLRVEEKRTFNILCMYMIFKMQFLIVFIQIFIFLFSDFIDKDEFFCEPRKAEISFISSSTNNTKFGLLDFEKFCFRHFESQTYFDILELEYNIFLSSSLWIYFLLSKLMNQRFISLSRTLSISNSFTFGNNSPHLLYRVPLVEATGGEEAQDS